MADSYAPASAWDSEFSDHLAPYGDQSGLDIGFSPATLDGVVNYASTALDNVVNTLGGSGDVYNDPYSPLDSTGGGNLFAPFLEMLSGYDAGGKLLSAAKDTAKAAATGAGATKTIAYDPNSPVASYAKEVAANYGLDPELFVRQLAAENGLKTTGKSPKGAYGVAQFMPATGEWVAQQMGVSREAFWSDPALQIQGAAWYMRYLLQKYGGDKAKALAAYNAGEGNVDRYGGIPPFSETQNYVQSIMSVPVNPMEGSPAAWAQPPATTGSLTRGAPVPGSSYSVSFGYGLPYDQPITGAGGRLITHHEGVDLVRPDLPNNGENSPVTPFMGGTVAATGADQNGKYVVILADDGLLHVYVHMNAINVTDGQRVDTTTQIGLLGRTGTEDFPHLHFGVRTTSGQPIDPTPYVNGR